MTQIFNTARGQIDIESLFDHERMRRNRVTVECRKHDSVAATQVHVRYAGAPLLDVVYQNIGNKVRVSIYDYQVVDATLNVVKPSQEALSILARHLNTRIGSLSSANSATRAKKPA